MKSLMIVILALAVGFLGYKWYAACKEEQRLTWSVSDTHATIDYLNGETKQLNDRLAQQEQEHLALQEEMSKISALSQDIAMVEAECEEFRTKIIPYENLVENHHREQALLAEQQQANLDAMRATREGRVLGEGETEAKRYLGKRGDLYFFQDGAGGWYVRKELQGWCDEALKIVAARDREDAGKLARLAELQQQQQAGANLSEAERVELDKLQKREQGFEARRREAELKKERMR